MLTDIQIAQSCQKKHILEVARKIDIDEKYIEQYGNYKAKIDYCLLEDLKDRQDGRLILVTAINPTSA
ncbi:MAG TPA: formate--tetrahydrofolate ligase, partial [Erysipelotrichaceae bacterium]|nr:formate--tetrahydrofolate ligase [Erysipelotrichaceae bacterium]